MNDQIENQKVALVQLIQNEKSHLMLPQKDFDPIIFVNKQRWGIFFYLKL